MHSPHITNSVEPSLFCIRPAQKLELRVLIDKFRIMLGTATLQNFYFFILLYRIYRYGKSGFFFFVHPVGNYLMNCANYFVDLVRYRRFCTLYCLQ